MRVAAVAAVALLPLQGTAFGSPSGAGSAATGSSSEGTVETTPYASHLTIDYKNRAEAFVGVLSSKFDVSEFDRPDIEGTICTAERTVEVMKARRTRSDKSIGTDVTNADGAWKVAADVSKGRYYATVTKTDFAFRDYYGLQYFGICSKTTTTTITP